MAYERRDIVGGAAAATLTAGLADLAVSTFTIDVTTGWPTGSAGPFYVVVDRGLANEEKIKCTSRASGTITVAARGADGTSAVAHTPGTSKVEVIATAVDLDEANYAVAQTVGKITTKGDLLVGTTANTLARVPAGTNNSVLIASDEQTAGVKYGQITPASVENLTGIAQGDIVTSATSGAFSVLSISGSGDYNVLMRDTSASTRMKWSQITNQSISGMTGLAKSDIVIGTGANTIGLLNTGTAGQVLSVDTDTESATGLKWIDKTVTQAQVTFTTPADYTPTWGGPANTDKGNGTLAGRWYQFGKLVWVQVRLVIGSTSNKGDDTTPWTFGLPTDAPAISGRPQIIPGYIHNAALSDRKPVMGLIRPNIGQTIGQIALADGSVVHKTNPYSWAWDSDLTAGAQLILEGWYERT